jgi:enamine deaminase RidA (YjgF/YER057c/UK114 family)
MFDLVNPPQLPPPHGFSHGLLARSPGRLLFVAGQTAATGEGARARGDLTSQFATALDNVIDVVRTAGGQPDYIAQLTIYVRDMEKYREARTALGGIWTTRMGSHYPAIALVEVRAFVDLDAEVEIQAIAVLP